MHGPFHSLAATGALRGLVRRCRFLLCAVPALSCAVARASAPAAGVISVSAPADGAVDVANPFLPLGDLPALVGDFPEGAVLRRWLPAENRFASVVIPGRTRSWACPSIGAAAFVQSTDVLAGAALGPAGRMGLHLLRPGGVSGSVCHCIQAFQDGQLVSGAYHVPSTMPEDMKQP